MCNFTKRQGVCRTNIIIIREHDTASHYQGLVNCLTGDNVIAMIVLAIHTPHL